MFKTIKRMDKIKDYFKRYPNSSEVFECGGLLFHTRGAAESYGKGDVKRYVRERVMSVDEASLTGVSGFEGPATDKEPTASGTKAKGNGVQPLKND